MKTTNTKLALLISFITLVSATLFGQEVEIQGNTTVTGELNVMDTIYFSDGTELASACLQILQDGDGDTKIEVEQSLDEDIIRFTSNGIQIAVLENGKLIIYGGLEIFEEYSFPETNGASGQVLRYNGQGALEWADPDSATSFSDTDGDTKIQVEKTPDDDKIRFDASGNEVMFLDNTRMKLFADLDIESHNLQFRNMGTGDSDKGIKFGSGNTGLIGLTFENNGNYQDKLHMKTFYDQIGASFMTFDGSNGHVGIGNESPAADLHIDRTTDVSLTSNGIFMLGPVTGENTVFDANEMQARNNGLAEDLNFNIEGGDVHFGTSTAEQKYEFRNGDILMSYSGGSDLNHGIKWAETVNPVFGFIYDGEGSGGNNRLHLRQYLSGTPDIMSIKASGDVGVGEVDPETRLHVKTSSASGHVMKIENTSSANTADGLEIKINRATTGLENNYITFNDANSTAGRIEGFAVGEGPNFTDFPGINLDLYFDVAAIIAGSFDPGSFPYPDLNTLELPDVTFDRGSIGSTTVNWDNFIDNVLCASNPLCAGNINNFSTFVTNTGFVRPTLAFDEGAFPTWVPGTLPALDLSVLLNPVVATSAYVDMQNIVNWALENGVEALSADPFHIALMNDPDYWANMATFKNGGVTYGSKGADYAEWLEREDPASEIKAGQIVGVKNGKISLKTEDADQIMAISVMPVVLGNMPDTTRQDEFEKVAFIGQTPVWVVGKVESGDYIIASGNNDGFGIPVAEDEITIEQVSQVVGRAWEGGEKMINLVNVAVGLKSNELANILAKTSQKVEALDQRLSKIEAMLTSDPLVSNH